MFTKEILQQRINRSIASMREQDIDIWISVGRESHLTVEPALLYLLPADVLPVCATIIMKDGESFCICGRLEYEEMISFSAFSKVVAYSTIQEFKKTLLNIIKENKTLNKVALNFSAQDPSADGLSFTQYKMITGVLKDADFDGEIVSSEHIMRSMRGCKCDEEIQAITHTVLTSMSIYEEARKEMHIGMSGAEIQRIFQKKVSEKAAGYSWAQTGNPFISVGAKSSYLCKRPPEDVYVEGGDLINVDFGLRIDGFASDNQRSFYALREGEREAPDEVVQAFRTVQEAIRAALKIMKPGIHTDELSYTANEVFIKNGYPAIKGFGHELGTFAHEGGLNCGTSVNKEQLNNHLENGMVFTMEPAIITSHGRLCQEEVVVVSPEGGRFLSIPQKEVWLIK